jgi:hypothetical protein
MSPSRGAGESFLSRHILEADGKKIITLESFEPSTILGEVDSLDDNCRERVFEWNITFQGDFGRTEQLVALSAEYPELEFWIQIWDLENPTPADLFPDFNFSRGVITERNLGDQLALDSDS